MVRYCGQSYAGYFGAYRMQLRWILVQRWMRTLKFISSVTSIHRRDDHKVACQLPMTEHSLLQELNVLAHTVMLNCSGESRVLWWGSQVKEVSLPSLPSPLFIPFPPILSPFVHQSLFFIPSHSPSIRLFPCLFPQRSGPKYSWQIWRTLQASQRGQW